MSFVATAFDSDCSQNLSWLNASFLFLAFIDKKETERTRLLTTFMPSLKTAWCMVLTLQGRL